VRPCVAEGDGTATGERLSGAHLFVCTHGARDARCGLCGPALIDAFREAIAAAGMEHLITVRGCSHTGGHKYAAWPYTCVSSQLKVMPFVPEPTEGIPLHNSKIIEFSWH